MPSRILSLSISLLVCLAIAARLCAEQPSNDGSGDRIGDAWQDSRNPIVRIFTPSAKLGLVFYIW